MLTIRYLTLLAAIIAFTTAYGQAKHEPTMLILAPNKVTYDKALEQEVAKYNHDISEAKKKGITSSLTEDTTGQPENIKMMVAHEMAFNKTVDFSRLTSSIAHEFLCYAFSGRFSTLLILVKDINSNGKAAELKKIAKTHEVQYVLNFPAINFYKDGDISKAKVSVQLYDQKRNALVINKDVIGDWRNPGGAFMCADSSLLCTINNALAEGLSEVGEFVVFNSELHQQEGEQAEQEEELSLQRFKVLANEYYNKPYDSAFIIKVIPAADTSINSRHLYQALVDDTKMKFIAFYIDNNDWKQPYYVRGAQHNGEWYYQKIPAGVIYQADNIELVKKGFFSNLQEWNFFKEGTLEYNPAFWETGQFAKVKDIRKDPDWQKYKEMMETEEHENRDYVGMYELVAEELKKRTKEENAIFDSLMGTTVFRPFYEAQKKRDAVQFSQFTYWGKKPTLIFPRHRQYALNPISVTDSAGQSTLHFYFAFAGSKTVYEWTYLPVVPTKQYSPEIIAQLEKVTKWNFSYTNLNDDQFWENYVLAKTGNEYKYLKRMQ